MWKAIKRVWHIFIEEAKRRGWVRVVKAIVLLAGIIGISIIALNKLVKWWFPQSVVAAWVVMISFAVVAMLLVVINFMRTYQERTSREAFEKWTENTALIEELVKLQWEGTRHANKCNECKGESLSADDMRYISGWHSRIAGILERNMGNEYRRRFYEHSKTFESAPSAPHECREWINTRLTKLGYVIEELKQPPAQLVSREEANQIRLP